MTDINPKIYDKSREGLSWILIALGAVSIFTAKVLFMARFVEINPLNPWAGLGQIMTWGELCFLLFPYLGLAYFRLYAAATAGTRRLTAVMAAAFLVSGLVLSFRLISGGRDASFNFYFHSLVCLTLQSVSVLPVVVGLWPGRAEGEWRPAEILALIPLLAAALMLMSNVSMMWTRQLTGTALAIPYIFLALDGVRRLTISLAASRDPYAEPVRDDAVIILKSRLSAVEFSKPSVVELLPGKAVFPQAISQKLPRQAQIGGGLFQ